MNDMRIIKKNNYRNQSLDIAPLILSLGISSMTVVFFFIVDPVAFSHWFVVPLILCGTLIGSDAISWWKGRMNIFDPIGIIGILGFHFFFLAPLLHVYWDYWMGRVAAPDDWRTWLGFLGLLNFLGLILYKFSRKVVVSQKKKVIVPTWTLDHKRFYIFAIYGLIITFLAQLFVYMQYGGITGYINAYSERENNFSGNGWLFMISESFPIILMMVYVVYINRNKIQQKWIVIFVVILAFFILRMFFGGLRGSRSNTIWALFWAVGLIHFWIRPINKKVVMIGISFLLVFMYVYGLYKGAGNEVLKTLSDSEYREEVQEQTGRTFETVVLGDLGRADVQAYLVYKNIQNFGETELAYGRTYIGALSLLIPRSIWEDRPATKLKEGTNALYGEGTFESGSITSSRIYGLYGEAILNFGIILGLMAFVVFGIVVGYISRFVSRVQKNDSRILIVPFMVNLCFLFLINDSDNMLFAMFKNGLIPFLVIYFSSIKHKRVGSNYEGSICA